jgi:hypothetical protein
MSSKFICIANFTCRFGERVLLDLAEDVVLPAFLRENIRKARGSEYFFADQSIVSIDGGRVVAIAGRFVKRTQLRREQFYDEHIGELVRQPSTMPSAPSALFVLVLNTHRLIYCPETNYPPSVESFALLSRKLLVLEHDKFLRRKQHEARETQRITLKALREEYPVPSVSVVPVAGSTELREFIDRYSTLKFAQVELLDVNDELDNEGFFRAVRARKNAASAKSTKIVHANKDGLAREAVYEQLEGPALQGTARIVLRGVDQHGAKINGDNENFTMRLPAPPDMPEEPAAAAPVLCDAARDFGSDVLQGPVGVAERVAEIYVTVQPPHFSRARRIDTPIWS